MGEVSGQVLVDGEPAPAGSSITFFPQDGQRPGGDLIEDGHYSTRVPRGMARVEIRAPRPLRRPTTERREGPGGGPGGPANIEESLPDKYNNQTELTFEVKPGSATKDWDLQSQP